MNATSWKTNYRGKLITLPYLIHKSKDPANRHLGFILADNVLVHRIKNLEEFYGALGFCNDMRKLGVFPEDFICCEYTKYCTAKNTACYQMHLLNYLIKYSDTFRNLYGNHYDGWRRTSLSATTARLI